jgi:hypothetical protein
LQLPTNAVLLPAAGRRAPSSSLCSRPVPRSSPSFSPLFNGRRPCSFFCAVRLLSLFPALGLAILTAVAGRTSLCRCSPWSRAIAQLIRLELCAPSRATSSARACPLLTVLSYLSPFGTSLCPCTRSCVNVASWFAQPCTLCSPMEVRRVLFLLGRAPTEPPMAAPWDLPESASLVARLRAAHALLAPAAGCRALCGLSSSLRTLSLLFPCLPRARILSTRHSVSSSHAESFSSSPRRPVCCLLCSPASFACWSHSNLIWNYCVSALICRGRRQIVSRSTHRSHLSRSSISCSPWYNTAVKSSL